MNTSDKKIAEVLAKFGEPMAGNVWRVQGNAVIYHKALERIAQQAKIAFDAPTIVRAERDECVILVTGRLGDRAEWSLGEALLGTNYRVSGKQAAYVYAMAEKRAKDRVILKLIELHGLVYSEEESDEFKGSQYKPEDVAEREQSRVHIQSGGGRGARDYLDEDRADDRQAAEVEAAGPEVELKEKIRKAKTINAVTDLMLHPDTQKILNDLPEGIRDEIRDCAKARLVEMGWPTKKEGVAARKVDGPKDATKKLELTPEEKAQPMIEELHAIRAQLKAASDMADDGECRKACNVVNAALVAWSKKHAKEKGALPDKLSTEIQKHYDSLMTGLQKIEATIK